METITGFSALKRGEILETIDSSGFDLIFCNCGIKEALTVLYASAMGYKCGLFCSGDFNSKVNPISFPVEGDKFTRKEIELVSAFRQQSAHIVLPDEFLWIRDEKMGLFKGVNFVMNKRQQIISLKDLNRYEPLLGLQNIKSVVLQENYKLDSYRLLMAVLKRAVELGAVILNHASVKAVEDNQFRITDLLHGHNVLVNSAREGLFTALEEGKSYEEVHFYLSSTKLRLKRSLRFNVGDADVWVIRRQDYFHVICRGDSSPKVVDSILERLGSLLDTADIFSSEDLLRVWKENYSRDHQLGVILGYVKSFLKDNFAVKGSRFTQTVEETALSGAYFNGKTAIHELIEFGDIRYDEAKQTGINSVDFKSLFYRYGSDIDVLTEEAYMLCRKISDPRLLWKYVEARYLIENEMTCDKKDLLQRAGVPIISDEDIAMLRKMGFHLF